MRPGTATASRARSLTHRTKEAPNERRSRWHDRARRASSSGASPCSPDRRHPSGGAEVMEAFIIDTVRTPVGRRGGALSQVHPADLGAHTLRELMTRTGVDPAAVE